MSGNENLSGTGPIAKIEYEMMLLTRHVNDLPRRSRRRGGKLDHSAYVLLSHLQVGGPMSIRGLADITGLDASTLNRQTAALLKHGYAVRLPDPNGGVARRFELTRVGADTLRDERETSKQSLAGVLADWPQDDVNEFSKFLRQFNTSVESRTQRPQPRPAAE